MASPFPGMDPYIEDPEIWSDFQNNLAAEIRAQLNAIIQPRHVARLIPRVTYDIVEVAQTRGIRPDVAVWPIQLWDKLPLLPVPLLEPDPDVPLDLAKAVTAVYHRGGYASLIDYSQPPPPPPLSDEEAGWLAEAGIGQAV